MPTGQKLKKMDTDAVGLQAYDRYNEADLTALAAMDPLRYANMLKLCKQGWTHEAFDPSAYFVCGFTDRSISPMADSSFLVPFVTGT